MHLLRDLRVHGLQFQLSFKGRERRRKQQRVEILVLSSDNAKIDTARTKGSLFFTNFVNLPCTTNEPRRAWIGIEHCNLRMQTIKDRVD